MHEICVNPESFLISLLMMTRPDLVGLGASWSVGTTTGCRVTVHSSNRKHDSGGRCSNDLNTTVKLDGKALGIVQLVGKGEGLEA